MSYRYERYNERPRRSGMRCLFVTLTILVWVVLLGILLVRFVVRPAMTNLIEGRFAERVPVERSQPNIEVPAVGSLLPALPAGSFTISEADANQWFAQNRDQLQGVDDVRLRFVPGEAQADLTMQGVSGTARADITAVDGRIVVRNAQLAPPLGWVVDVAPLATLLQDQLNAELAASNRRATSAVVEQGKVTLTVE